MPENGNKSSGDESTTSFTVKVSSPLTIVGVGPRGEFEVERQGWRPELGYGYRYKDRKYDFVIYVEFTGKQLNTLVVRCAMPPDIEPVDLDSIKSNITEYFQAVATWSVDKVMPPEAVPAVIFPRGPGGIHR